MSELTIKATVLIPTYNRERLLKEALESLTRQTVDPRLFEVIIVDNCSTDATEAMVRNLQPVLPFKVIYRRNEVNGGCFRSLNTAAEMAHTEILASLDSDTWADPHWLERGIQAFEEDPDVAFVAGHIADKPGQPVRFFSLRNGAPKTENLFYPSGNCFYRRSVFLKLGGFDTDLSFGDIGTSPIGCADSDLAWRMREAGYHHAYLGDMIVYHEVSTVSPTAWLKAHWRIVAVPPLIRRHPGLRGLLTWKLFFLPDNALFYLMVLAVAGVFVTPLTLLLAAPYILRASISPGRRLSPLQLPRVAARVAMLSLRQTVICLSLMYGSVRSRTLVL